jgi:hypothetical protein
MNNTVYFDDVPPYSIEHKIGFDDEHAVAQCLKLFMLGNTAGKRMSGKTAFPLFSSLGPW